MSNGLGRYHFLAWARQGMAASLANPDSGGSLPARGTLMLGLTVSATGPTPSSQSITPVTVQTYGPGDVLGIDPRHVVRAEPRDSTTNFEPNYLAAIDFDEPDFPWLFTPAAPAGDRIRPWLVLIALKTTEYTVVPGVPQPLAAVDVGTLSALQSLDDSWNWAHAQVSGDGGLAGTIATAPGSVISRLICPRRLDPESWYTAFVVPAFEIGRRAGLGIDVSGVTTSDPAWTSTTPVPLRLPVYYQFQFHTSDQGDFESLVRRLTPTKLGANIGQRPMLVDAPAADFPSAGAPLSLDGALQSLAITPTPWNDPAKTAFQTALNALVNRTSPVVDQPNQPDPQLVPPLYGCWAAGVFSVSPAGTGWFDGLNLDPRSRTQSGMGTQVIHANLTTLLASAWQQVAGVENANALLRRAQLARGVLTMLHTERFSIATSATLLSLTAPVHARLVTGPQTVAAAIATSRVPARLFSFTFRRIASPAAAIRRRQTLSGASIGSLVHRVNASAVTIVPPPAPPGGLVAIEDIAGTSPSGAGAQPLTHPIAGEPVSSVHVAAAARPVDGPVRLAGLTPGAAAAVPPRPGYTVTKPGVHPPTTGTGATDSTEATLFRQALSDLTSALQAPAPDPPLAPALDLDTLSKHVLTKLDPATTVPARMASLVTIASHLNWKPPDPIRTIMAAPTFPRPMYAPLRDLATQYILPGADQVPADSVSLLQVNHPFIEAYMVGLNHEMARQLLWVGYPTDCMGTYFRQFWDVSNYVPQTGDPTNPAQLSEMLKDIPPIMTWPLAGPLGTHENRTKIVANNVVLLIRGELLRRYPDTIIYAAKAKLAGNQRVIDTSDERYPIFGGTLPGDMTFVGFNLSPQDAKGGTAAAPQGFFFVFQQHPSGPRFGLEPSASGTVTHWSDLAWTNFARGVPAAAQPQESALAAQPQELAHAVISPVVVAARKFVAPWAAWRLPSLVFRDVLESFVLPDFLSASLSPSGTAISGSDDSANRWGVNAAETAYITLRLPFRIAIHADLMVPSS